MNITMKALKFLVGVASLALFSISSHATLVSSASSNPLNFNWTFIAESYLTLTGNGSMTVTGFGTNTLTMSITLNNTTTGSYQSRLTSFGFGIDPNAKSVVFSDPSDTTGMIGATLAKIPSLSAIEVCTYGGNNCAGGRNGGIFQGASDTFTLSLLAITNTTWGTSIDIAPIGFKYQTGTRAGSYEFTTGSSSNGIPVSTNSPIPTPEPSSVVLLGLGLIASVFSLRRRSISA